MHKISTSEELRATIQALEIAQHQDAAALKNEFQVAYQQIQPINIIKNTVKEAIHSSDLKSDMIKASVGIVLGFISKALFEGRTHSPARKLVGTALMFGVTNIIINNPKFATTVGVKFINLFRISPSPEVLEIHDDPLFVEGE
ncbi:MAG: hypothetical protein K9I85_15860 [Saprospiraceae bacterium]|nr:hypothetical protein [Saprospiraceae bacterium]